MGLERPDELDKLKRAVIGTTNFSARKVFDLNRKAEQLIYEDNGDEI